MVGIIGYAVPSKTGVIVRNLRQKLGIDHQLTIYHHSLGGWDNRWARDTWLNGAPQDEKFQNRWEWEVQQQDLSSWVASNKIDTVIFVGSTYGPQTTALCKKLGLKVIFVAMFDHEASESTLQGIQDVDVFVFTDDVSFGGSPIDNKIELPYPIVDDQAIDSWKGALQL